MLLDDRQLAPLTFSVDQVLAMDSAGLLPSDRRIELIGGELFVMASPGPVHTIIVTRLQSSFSVLNGQLRLLVQQHIAIEDFDLPSPDLLVLRAPLQPRLVRPADVMLLIEVSDSTYTRDATMKLPQYLRAGVPEVWIVNVRARQVEVYRDGSLIPLRVVGVPKPGAALEYHLLDMQPPSDFPLISTGPLFEGLDA